MRSGFILNLNIMNTIKIIKFGMFEHTVVKVPKRAKGVLIDIKGVTTEFDNTPCYDGKPDMALQSIRRLTRSEMTFLKIKAETLRQLQDGTY